jgi:hypothetical protein
VEASRIIIFNLPRLLGEIIERTVGDQPDMEIVEAVPDATLRAALEASGADFVIAGPNGDVGDANDLLAGWPSPRLLAVAGDGREGFLYELCPARRPLGEISPQTIVDAIRSERCAS